VTSTTTSTLRELTGRNPVVTGGTRGSTPTKTNDDWTPPVFSYHQYIHGPGIEFSGHLAPGQWNTPMRGAGTGGVLRPCPWMARRSALEMAWLMADAAEQGTLPPGLTLRGAHHLGRRKPAGMCTHPGLVPGQAKRLA
jgi:hypothetical protein